MSDLEEAEDKAHKELLLAFMTLSTALVDTNKRLSWAIALLWAFAAINVMLLVIIAILASRP